MSARQIQDSRCCRLLRRELRWQNLWFVEKNPAKFATTAWLQSQYPFLVYRIVCFVYSASILGWSSYTATQLPTERDVTAWFLSFPVWSFNLLTIYNSLALLLSAFNFDYDCLCNDDLSWYHKVCWILHVVSFNGATCCLLGTIIYHIANATQDSTVTTCMEIFNSDDINFYAISAVVMFTDVFIHSIPIRILHFTYPVIFFTIYVLIHVYRYAAGYVATNLIFSFTSLPIATTTVFLLFAAFIYVPTVHLLAYGIDTLRRRLILKIRSRNKRELLHAVNSSFTENTPETSALQTLQSSVRYNTSVLKNNREYHERRTATIQESRDTPTEAER